MSDAPSSGPAPPAERIRNPWWIPPFLGRVPAVGEGPLRVVGVVGLALLFENYDQSMLTAALKHIAEGFGIPESDLGEMLGFVHLGSVAAFLLIPFADRIGRRRLFLVSVIGLSAATVLSAFAQSVAQFVVLQMLGRAFMVTCSATAFVIVTEEFPAEHRGWGIGILGALGSMGYGLGLGLFAAIDILPYGWRALYVVGVVPLVLLPRFRRRIQETARFRALQQERGDAGEGFLEGWLRPLADLARAYPWRTAAIGAIGIFGSAGGTVGFVFTAFHVQSVHGWSPGQYSAMAVIAGTVGIIGNVAAGRIADRHGRRGVGFVLYATYPLFVLAFYNGPGWVLPLVWIPLIFGLTGANTINRAFATELFPTSFRGTSAGWLMLTEAAGRSIGLFLVAFGTPDGGSNVPMISLVGFASLLAGVVIWLLPETGRRELESISTER